MNNKRVPESIPCDLCQFTGTLDEYTLHIKNTHKDRTSANKNKEDSNELRSQPKAALQIPCDICKFIASSTTMYVKHIETKHQTKDNASNTEESCFSCDKCNFTAVTEREFKSHLEHTHRLRVKENRQNSMMNTEARLCIYWNRGRCSYGQQCKFIHKDIPACTFQNRCNRSDCKFWHEATTGKFPFLGQMNFPHPPPFRQFARPYGYGNQ